MVSRQIPVFQESEMNFNSNKMNEKSGGSALSATSETLSNSTNLRIVCSNNTTSIIIERFVSLSSFQVMASQRGPSDLT